MTQHVTTEEIATFQLRTLPPAEVFRIWAHASECPRCEELLRQPERIALETLLARAAFEDAPAHLSYDDIEGYVDRELAADERTRVEMHVAACKMCAGDVASITELRDKAQASERAAVTSRAVGESPRVGQRGSWSWVAAWGAGLAAAVAVLLAVFLVPHRHAALGPPLTATQNSSRIPDGLRPPAIRDGHRTVRVVNGFIAGLDGLPWTNRQAVLAALTSDELNVPHGGKLRPQRENGVLMGSPAPRTGVRLVFPLDQNVLEQMPVLRWTPQKGAMYRVSVGDREFNEVTRSEWLGATSWRVPVKLQRGKVYTWQVLVRWNGTEVAVPAPPQPAAQFGVLHASVSDELERLRSSFGDSHLVMGTAFASHGMWTEAGSEFRKLQDDNPHSPLVAGLLAKLDKARSSSSALYSMEP